MLHGDRGGNRIEGGAGNDLIDGRGGNNILVGGAGADTIFTAGYDRETISDFAGGGSAGYNGATVDLSLGGAFDTFGGVMAAATPSSISATSTC